MLSYRGICYGPVSVGLFVAKPVCYRNGLIVIELVLAQPAMLVYRALELMLRASRPSVRLSVTSVDCDRKQKVESDKTE